VVGVAIAPDSQSVIAEQPHDGPFDDPSVSTEFLAAERNTDPRS
jgi:hypothetical protein